MRQLGFALALSATTLVAACADQTLTRESSPTGPKAALHDDLNAASATGAGITIVLDMQPNRPTDITFETEGTKLKDFILDDDVNSAVPSSRSFTHLRPGAYAIKQEVVTGLTLLDLRCESDPNGGSGIDNNTINLADRSVTIQLERDELVTCTFVDYQPLWQTGDVISYTQSDWGDTPSAGNAASLLVANFDNLYPGGLQVGSPGPGFWIVFASSASVLVYLPASGFPGALTQNFVDPVTTSSGIFGGLVTALALNVDFSDAGFTLGTARIPFGNLTLCSFSDLPNLNGLTVRESLAAMNTALGGASAIYVIDPYLTGLAIDIDLSFRGGTPSQFAQDHLVYGPCP